MQHHQAMNLNSTQPRAAVPAQPLAGARSARRWRGAWPYVAAGLLALAAAAAAYQAVLDQQLDNERLGAARRLDFVTLSLEAILERNEALPNLLRLEHRLSDALDAPQEAAQAANIYLQSVAEEADVSAAYLMDDQGLTIAASNWNRPVTFLGESYGFRPYVLDALAGRTGRFYGIGATSGEPGYFLASRVVTPLGHMGVVAVRLNLLPFEDALRQGGDTVMVVDTEGVVILSSHKPWRYRVLEPLTPEAMGRLALTRQYASEKLTALDDVSAIRVGMAEVRLPAAAAGPPGARHTYSIVRRSVGPLGWQVLMLADQAPARQVAAMSALAAAGVVAFVLGVALHLRLQRQRRVDRTAARQALQQANDVLEQRIAQRTADLTATNEQLAAKVEALKQAEAILQETRDSAVQAGKLAVLGQMSAGMTHELNQPLGALHTLSDNTIRLLGQDRLHEARENLRLISELAARMGNIVRQLKMFARKEPTMLTRVDLRHAIDNALLLVQPRRQEVRAEILVELEGDGLRVKADEVRLEQVFVNLLRNGLDAVEHEAVRTVTLRCAQAGMQVRVDVSDTGPGLPQEALERLGEPFYTTKPAGRGLGLGLALSMAIVESFGGRVQAGNGPGGGAEFRVLLERA